MRKILLFILIFALAGGASWFANHAGSFEMHWLGWHIEGSVAFLLICFIAISVVLWLILHWLNAILSLPKELKKERNRLLNEKGLQAMTNALIASSENDGELAKKHLNKARNYLPDSPLPRLLQLQVAGRSQDAVGAHQQFVQLQSFDSTKHLALRGLAEQARVDGKMDEALTHTEALLEQAPEQASTQKLAIDIFSYHRRWQEALRLLKKAYAQRNITVDEYRRARATVAMQQASLMMKEQNRQGAMDMLKKATTTDPSLQPAAVAYAKLLKQVGKNSHAVKILKQSWKHSPHPQVAATYLELFADLDPAKKAKKLQELARQNSESIESHIVQSQAAMLLEEWDIAKNHLKVGLSKQTTIGLCKQMAALQDKGFKNEAEHRKWLEKAVTATPDASWHCLNCGSQPEDWEAHCRTCYDFASIHWMPEKALTA